MKSIGIKILVEISRVLLGVTFMFSGFVKAVDPWGTAYKIEDYLSAFNLSSLSFLAFPASAFLCMFEFIMGAFMLFGLYRAWNTKFVLLTMCFMTPLTLYLAVANPVEDCGCFGDAWVITNWQTFYKNIVLLVCAIITVIYYEKISNVFTGKTYWLAFLFILIFSLGFVIRNYIYEPIFDFRPYHIGANIPSQMVVKEGQEYEEESILIYARDGVEKEFSEENYPWEDSTWVFVRMDARVINQGEDPKVKDFTLTKLDFNNSRTKIIGQRDITDDILSDSNYTFLMISPFLDRMSIDHLSSFEDVESYANENDYNFYCLTASVTDEIVEFIDKQSVSFSFCTVDERVLKTISRSNPGLILLKDGNVINKWADLDVPSEENLQSPLENLSYSTVIDKAGKDRENLICISIIFFLPLLMLKGIDFLAFRKRKKQETK